MRSIRPATGARLTWQLNTLMKIETRSSGRSPRPSSAGGIAFTIIETRPSAGETTMPSRTGVTRIGSRKNSAHQIVSTVPIQPSGVQIQNRIRLASAKPPMKGYPSGWIGGICARIELATDIGTRSEFRNFVGWAKRPIHDRQPARGESVPTILNVLVMVGTAHTRLCPPYTTPPKGTPYLYSALVTGSITPRPPRRRHPPV